MQFEQFLINPSVSIINAMERLEKSREKILYVVNENNILLGAVTDGDIRRHILKVQSLQGEVSQLMYKNVRYLTKDSQETPTEYMHTQGLTSIPIVDKNMKVLAIEFLKGEKYYRFNNLNIPIVIMAGGKGTRLHPYTQILPKPLIPIGEKTITEHIMDNFEKFGCSEFFMVINYKKELIKAFFYDMKMKHNVKFIEENSYQGTAGGLRLIKNKIQQTFFMTNCDILVDENYGDILRYHKSSGNIITMVCALKRETIPYGIISTSEDGRIKEVKEKPQLEFLTNTGLYVVEPQFLEQIGESGFVHITDVIQKCIDKQLRVGVYPISENDWLDMGQMEQLDNMKKRLGIEGTH